VLSQTSRFLQRCPSNGTTVLRVSKEKTFGLFCLKGGKIHQNTTFVMVLLKIVDFKQFVTKFTLQTLKIWTQHSELTKSLTPRVHCLTCLLRICFSATELLIFVHLTVTSADVGTLRLVCDRSFSRYAVCFNYRS
jgi:hypothetical protein